MNRECPNGHGVMEQAMFHEVEVDYCPTCLGIWFDADELTYAKNNADYQLNWLDFDIWRHKEKFEALESSHRCPVCRIPLARLAYDNSSVRIDFCKNCRGIWLDRGEFKQIMVYLKKKADYEILHHYTKNLIKQLWEVFHGPKQF
ncbi:MAG: zf-TFIIB domain-containing protein, partial [Candidatus Saccharimonadales bacterium]